VNTLIWALIAAIGVVLVGLIFGIAGIFIAPILGVVGVVALLMWLGNRRARHEPPLE
jgi:cyanate permease